MYCTDLLQVCVSHSKEECHTTYEEVCKPVYHKPTYQTAAHNGKQCEQVPKKECKYVQVNNTRAANRSISSTTGCTITEKAPTRAFSWLKAPTSAFTFKTLLRHYAKQALTPRSLKVKLGP